MREALSAYAGPMPRRVVPICSLPSRRSDAWSIATCHGMIRCAFPESTTIDGSMPRSSSRSTSSTNTCGSTTQPGADHGLSCPETTPLGIWRSFHVSPSTTIVCPAFGPALVAAHDVRLLGEQVDDLALALVAPLRADDDGRRARGAV